MEKSLDELRRECEDAKRRATLYQNQIQRLENRVMMWLKLRDSVAISPCSCGWEAEIYSQKQVYCHGKPSKQSRIS